MTRTFDRPLSVVVRALRSGDTSSEELTRLAVERHDRVGNRMGAYKAWDAEGALAQARAVDTVRRRGFPCAPFAGVPVSVKDLYGVEGYPTYAGTPRRLPVEWEREGFLVRALRRQLAVVTGKTHTVELAFGGLGNNPHWGTPVNPWDAAVHRVPGGSSCGAPVSLWEGSALVALGTDTAGSIRVPAAISGTVGHMTTSGRWPVDGLVPLSPTLDVVGALSRSVEDAAFFFAAVDPRHGDPERFLASLAASDLAGVRIGVFDSRVWTEGQGDIIEPVERALRALEGRGARRIEIELPEFDAAFDLYASGRIVPPECSVFVEEELPGWMELLHPMVSSRLRAAGEVSATDHLRALSRRRVLQQAAASRLSAVDVLATPTVAFTPPALAAIEDLEPYMRHNRRITYGTNPVNVLGWCAITMPCGLDDTGMPVGLQLIGQAGLDERLLNVALAAERVLGSAAESLGEAPLGAVGR